MSVRYGGKILRCRCPSPTKIGHLSFTSLPCLILRNDTHAKTSHTVEAIRIKGGRGDCWLGINQTRINAICEYFIDRGAFSRMVKNLEFRREGKCGDSKIDFVSADTLLEIKAPLTVLPTKNSKASFSNYEHIGDYARTIKHCKALARFARTGKRAIILLAYMYPAPRFNPIKQNGNNKQILRAFRLARESGVEFWQANFGIDRKGIRLIKYCRLCDKNWFPERSYGDNSRVDVPKRL